jgi:hypothetical protein
MNGLNGARVLLLDDEAEEALPVIRAFSKVGVPTVFFDGREGGLPTKSRQLRGVRLAILDMNLGVTGADNTIASTLVQTFSKIISPENGPYGVLIWTNHPDLKDAVARYIHEHATLPKPVFIVMLKKAAFKTAGSKGGKTGFSMGKLSKELLKVLAENSPLECMQVWEGACFSAATNVTNAIAELSDLNPDPDQWRQAWRQEALKLLLVIGRARAEEHLTPENCIPSIFLALNPLHSDRMDVVVEELSEDLSGHVNQIMTATGESKPERKGKINSMLHLGSDRLEVFNPGNLFVFGKRNKPSFMPSMKDALQDCIEGNPAQLQPNTQAIMDNARLCGVEITPVCDHAQDKMGLSRIIAGFAVPWDHQKKIKGRAQFLKTMGPFYFAERALTAGAYMLFLNSRYVAAAKPGLVKKLRAVARVRPQLLADVQSWASYQAARQGVMLLK